MRAIRILLVLLSACLTTGCYVVSVSGLADTASSAFDENLLGQWKSAEDGVELVIARDEWRSYAVTMRDRSGEQRFTARLVTIGDSRYVDLTIQNGLETNPAVLPVHLVGRVTQKDDTLEVELLDYDWFRGRHSRGSLTTPAVVDERDTILLTGTRSQLRKWLAANASSSRIFAEALVLTRASSETR